MSNEDIRSRVNETRKRAYSLSQRPAPKETPSRPRILGLFENVGETWMSNDLDVELPDSFWPGKRQA